MSSSPHHSNVIFTVVRPHKIKFFELYLPEFSIGNVLLSLPSIPNMLKLMNNHVLNALTDLAIHTCMMTAISKSIFRASAKGSRSLGNGSIRADSNGRETCWIVFSKLARSP